MTVAALFVRADSHYKTMPGVDAYDAARDALSWPGGCPGVFHPPCRAWGKLKGLAKPRHDEKDLARWAIAKVREFGGVLEHPLHSGLWRESGCLSFGIRDAFGGLLVSLNQSDFGHRADKATALYLVGCSVPSLPFDLVRGSVLVEQMGRAERERTPEPFARFLVELASSAS